MIDLIVTYYALAFGLLNDGIETGGVHLYVDGFFALAIMLMPIGIVATLAAYAVDWLRDSSRTAACRCLTAHPDDPTPCASCCTRWERLRFTVENFVAIRVLRKRTCICGEH